MTLLHFAVKAQTQKHIVQWTQMLRAFPVHGGGEVVLLNGQDGSLGEGSQSVGSGPKLLVRECSTMWALTSKSH